MFCAANVFAHGQQVAKMFNFFNILVIGVRASQQPSLKNAKFIELLQHVGLTNILVYFSYYTQSDKIALRID